VRQSFAGADAYLKDVADSLLDDLPTDVANLRPLDAIEEPGKDVVFIESHRP
jgi:hypothetical protein